MEGEKEDNRKGGRKERRVDPSQQNAEHFNLLSLVQMFS